MIIRKTEGKDLDRIMEIYDLARAYMAENGNPSQWGNGYPERSLIEQDMEQGVSYVFEEDGRVTGTFAFIIGADPTYQKIEKGAWHSDETYGTIHRLATDGKTKGISKACFDFCSGLVPYLRVDTHGDNQTMQKAVLRYGFEECGIIYVEDGTPRIAYDYRRKQD